MRADVAEINKLPMQRRFPLLRFDRPNCLEVKTAPRRMLLQPRRLKSECSPAALTNHKPRRSKNGDAGYIHPDLDDLRASQQRMTDYLLAQIKPKPIGGKKRSGNVIEFKSARG
jgi:hypothetical protein